MEIPSLRLRFDNEIDQASIDDGFPMMSHQTFFRVFLLSLAIAFAGCAGCGDPNNGGADTDVSGDSGVDMADAGAPDSSPNPDTDETDMDRPNDDVFVWDGSRDATEEDTGPIVLRIDAVLPPRGPVDGGTSFVVRGEGFTEDSALYFGSREAEFELIDGELVGETPPGAGPGAVNVKVLDPTYGQETLEGGFEYILPLAIESVVPERIPTTGGVEVTVRGRGFNAESRVSFGGTTGVRHEVVDETLMRVVAPAHDAGRVDVRVTNRDASFVLPSAVTYFDALRVDRVRPATGSTAGGDNVTVEGAGFVDGMTVEFGGSQGTVQSVAAGGDSAQVVTPAHAAGAVDVRLETPAGDATIARDAFYFGAAGEFSVASVTPAQGMAVGGNEVTLLGAGLDVGGLTVTFGGSAATVVDQGPGHAVVQTPAHAVGLVDVTIDDGSQTDTLTNGFEYVDDLWIDRVTPDTGDVAGGYDVVLEGEGFTGATDVQFGGISSAFTVDSPTQITATAPAHSAGVVDVLVERGGVSATFLDAFTFTEPLEVYGLTPVRGAVAGNTYVEIRGRGFVGSPDVTFDDIPSTDVQILDAQTLAVRTPPHPSAVVDVDVTIGGETVTSPTPYTYFNPGSRFGGAWGSPINGAVNVTVYSTDGQPLEGAFVMLSTNPATPYQGTTDVNGMVTLSGPDLFGEQTVTATYRMKVDPTPCVPPIDWTASATVQRVDAENITIFLSLDPPPPMGPTSAPEDGCMEGTRECYCRLDNPPCDDDLQCNLMGICCPPPPEPPTTPTATFTGYLSGLDKLAEPGPDEFQMAIVYTTQTDPFSQNPPPGDGNVVLTNGNYTITSRIGDLALIAVGGLYNNTTDTFTPLMMGAERYLFAADGETYTVDLDLDIPMDTGLSFKLNNAPSYTGGPNINEVVPYLDLGFEGVFGGVDIASGTGEVVTAEHQVALTGLFDDAEYMAIGGAYTNGNLPQTVGIQRGITNTSAVTQLPGLVGIAHVTSPQAGTPPVSGLIEFDLREPVEPDFFYVTISVPSLAGLKQMWAGFVPGSQRSLRLPDFPDFGGLPAGNEPLPYPPGTYIMDIVGIQKSGFVFDNLSYNDLAFGDWEAYSYSRTQLTFQ